MTNAAKNKGAQFERDLAKYFSEQLNLAVSRAYFTRDPLMAKGEGASDLIGLPHLAVEAKRVESLSFPAAMKQAKKNAQANECPVVINRRSRQKIEESYVLLELDAFVAFYEAWLQREGYLNGLTSNA